MYGYKDNKICHEEGKIIGIEYVILIVRALNRRASLFYWARRIRNEPKVFI